MAASSVTLDALFNHLVFPTQLPSKGDNIAPLESALLNRILATATNLRYQLQGHFQSSYDTLQTSLQACRSIHINRNLDRRALAHELSNIQPKHILILHITEQNSGLLVWRQTQTGPNKVCHRLLPLNMNYLYTAC
jgi:hypothetical protein